MTKIVKISVSICLFGALFCQGVYAQQVTTNDKGEKIILYPDGTWELYKESTQGKTVHETEISPDTSQRSSAYYTLGSRNEPTTGTPGISRRITDLAERLKSMQTQLRVEHSGVRKQYFTLKEDLQSGKRTKSITPEKEVSLKAEIKKVEAQMTELESQINLTGQRFDKARSIHQMPETKKEKALQALVAEIEKERKQKDSRPVVEVVPVITEPGTAATTTTAPPITEPPVVAEPTKVYPQAVNMDESKWQQPNPQWDVMLYPPATPCNKMMVSKGKASVNDKYSRYSILFDYTSQEMKQYLRDRPFIRCLVAIEPGPGSDRLLKLTFIIASQFAQREFGGLEKGSPLGLKFIDGSQLILINNKSDIGKVDMDQSTTTYEAVFTLGKSDLKKIYQQELDKVKVIWSTGFEEYPVYEVDLLINLLRCQDQS